jgi:hypothetical protein
MVKGTFWRIFPNKSPFFEETSYETAKILEGFGQFFLVFLGQIAIYI